ncbi:MAG TPA: succinyldiaminopimelate transaminase [Mycobacteriales bacterium]|nr:succinyldiaminopimelate transaminase [Mycobacteriales bacterium]
MKARSLGLPDFPWDRLVPYADIARAHPDGIVDLSVGTPVDPTPDVVRAALEAASNAPGYPLTTGSEALRAAIRRWLVRRCHAPEDVGILPTIGSKQLVALLPTLLGLGPGDAVLIPSLAYPTYAVGAQLAGCEVVTAPRDDVRLVWMNSPSNPTGRVSPHDEQARIVRWARGIGAVVASDECYLDLGYDETPVSALDPLVRGGSLANVLAVHSLSKRSSAAGYRLGVVAGDPELVAGLLEASKHAGLIVPEPVQAAGVAAFDDEEHVEQVRLRYLARRDRLRPALRAAGFEVDHSSAGLYLWSTRGEDCWDTVAMLAEQGILVAPGEFYGPAGQRHVRVALTATDERIDAAVTRLALL